ncbi:hypothetical protein [uncultured Draconibacterium sp.]|uniref:hypothetical protein n=1 Tax=uncultured Draconibacterium sp. TaxID=1573823 RepID=UPI0032165A24
MKKLTFFIFLMLFAFALGTNSCQESYLPEEDSDDVVLKKAGKPADVEEGDLYGDLIEVERNFAGVPVLYPLAYAIEYQDEMVTGIIDVHNPRLTGSFMLNSQLISPVNGFIENPLVLYDAEGELLEAVTAYVYPIEQGRLNLVRSPRAVLASRMTEVLKNFGDGTVADVVRDYCGRLYMIRTQAALNLGIGDKPIDSPLENLALYYELMNFGFSRSASSNGLNFLTEDDNGFGGFRFQSRLDNEWGIGARQFPDLIDQIKQRQFVANLAAACVAAASDKSNFLTFDEISYLNQFMGIPYIPNFDSSKDQYNEVQCFFPVIQQEVRMINKTDKTQYSKYRYYVDYSNFVYNRFKFADTKLDLYSIEYDDSTEPPTINRVLVEAGLALDDILSGGYEGDVLASYRYTEMKDERIGALGFSNQADDYVQALEVVHNNEEFLVWQMPTPTWSNADHIIRNTISPFLFEAVEESHGNKPPGKGDTETLSSRGSGRR